MAHLSEGNKRLNIQKLAPTSKAQLLKQVRGFNGVCLIRLPAWKPDEFGLKLNGVGSLVKEVVTRLGKNATIITIGEPIDLVNIHAEVDHVAQYQLWIAIKKAIPTLVANSEALPLQHFDALVHTRYPGSLKHAKTRIQYTYCPVCDKTTKDYGGKKHTYNSYGTLISDIWRDVTCDPDGDLTPVYERFADIFGIEKYEELRVLDCRQVGLTRNHNPGSGVIITEAASELIQKGITNTLLEGDCLKKLAELPENSVDFAFADPPYNLGKKYTSYADDMAITEYFEWCDQWIGELGRVLRPGRTCAILNIPLWAIRHFLHMESILQFQNWIAWDALSFPVRKIMPAHYAILCFSKGKPRKLPGLTTDARIDSVPFTPTHFDILKPLAEGYCLRATCVKYRKLRQIEDRGMLTDLWWDIHRLKHNSRRVDHPCQLPPQLMYRLISIFTNPEEVVLDCFNGAGTTTLAAHQLNRQYIGIEMALKYHKIAAERHKEILIGVDPFRKADRVLTAKNSPVPRMPKQVYEVPKKTLQLEVKRIANILDRLPTREEVEEFGKYPIKYYDEYFTSWGEVCAAARTDGMSEVRQHESRGETEDEVSVYHEIEG